MLPDPLDHRERPELKATQGHLVCRDLPDFPAHRVHLVRSALPACAELQASEAPTACRVPTAHRDSPELKANLVLLDCPVLLALLALPAATVLPAHRVLRDSVVNQALLAQLPRPLADHPDQRARPVATVLLARADHPDRSAVRDRKALLDKTAHLVWPAYPA